MINDITLLYTKKKKNVNEIVADYTPVRKILSSHTHTQRRVKATHTHTNTTERARYRLRGFLSGIEDI
jgi:hypothetical protein